MTDILVRNVPDETIEALKQRARQNRRSLQQELVSILETTALHPSTHNAAHVASQIRAKLASSGREFGDSVDLVREDRER